MYIMDGYIWCWNLVSFSFLGLDTFIFGWGVFLSYQEGGLLVVGEMMNRMIPLLKCYKSKVQPPSPFSLSPSLSFSLFYRR